MWCSGESADPHCRMLGTVAHGDNAGNQLQKWLRTNIDDAYDFQNQQSSGVEVGRLCLFLACVRTRSVSLLYVYVYV